jgi:UDP-N-acetylmuramoyl-tripeptide--D-alanyl-D-alanine ligase
MSDLAALNNSLMTLDELLCAVDGSLIGESFDCTSFSFTNVVTDSRNVTDRSLFVPLIGEFQDGHKYIPGAIEKGASVVFAARSSFDENPDGYIELCNKHPDTAFILVLNTLTALQKAAEAYVAKFPDLIRVSVTGSSGKTTTKEICASVLGQKYKLVCNKGNLNSETGLPLSCFEIRSEHQLALLEMGMNRVNEIGELAQTFKPQYGVITNIGTAHIGMLGSRQKIAEEKKKIFNFLEKDGTAVIPAADDFADFLAEGVKGRIVYYGKDVKNNGIEFVSDDGIDGTTFKVDGVTVHLSIPGVYNYLNALAAVELGRALGLGAAQIKKGIEDVKPLSGRSHILKGKYTVLEDCYNANPDSMEKAVEFAGSVKISGKKIFVLGSMLELGEESCEAHKKAGLEAVKGGADMIVFVGKEMLAGYEAAKNCGQGTENLRLEYFENHSDEDMKAVCKVITDFALPGDFILLKASHSIALDRLVPLLNGGGKA